MTAAPRPAYNRVRKTRWPSVLSCGHYVSTGQPQVRRGGKWTCLECALDAIRARTSTEGKHP